MSQIINEIREVLFRTADEKTRIQGEKYFNKNIKIYGLKAIQLKQIGKQYYKTIMDRSKSNIFSLCEELWKSGYLEEAGIACMWSYNVRKQYEPGDFKIFEKWVQKYISNWAACDTFCNHTIGTFIEMYPSFVDEMKRWARSENRWVKRGAAVSFIVPARKGKFLDDILEIADILHSDPDDMVQKGYGWMLKIASQAHQKEVFGYVMKKKKTMPRTALRYAIEKMPTDLKRKAMTK